MHVLSTTDAAHALLTTNAAHALSTAGDAHALSTTGDAHALSITGARRRCQQQNGPQLIIHELESVTSDAPTRRNVILKRGPDGYGFSIVGGYGSPHGNLPIYIKTVSENTSQGEGRLRTNDQILAVDGLKLDGLTHQEVVQILKNANDVVTLTILS
ncbi:hypothetical protein U1Q18_051769 [Sarracenia purpurea var. burkii]